MVQRNWTYSTIDRSRIAKFLRSDSGITKAREGKYEPVAFAKGTMELTSRSALWDRVAH
jgi:hypothetical protein